LLAETWEEGGVRGKIIGQLRAFDDMEAGRNPTTFRFYVMQVEQVADDWPEAHERERLWVPADHALDKCDKHSMQQAISYYLKQYNK
jgi:hypothetical protein